MVTSQCYRYRSTATSFTGDLFRSMMNKHGSFTVLRDGAAQYSTLKTIAACRTTTIIASSYKVDVSSKFTNKLHSKASTCTMSCIATLVPLVLYVQILSMTSYLLLQYLILVVVLVLVQQRDLVHRTNHGRAWPLFIIDRAIRRYVYRGGVQSAGSN